MRLIDVEPLECVVSITPKDVDAKSYNEGYKDALELMDKQPTIDAVPLDKLCEWLAGVASGNQSICCECAGSNDAPCPDENELCKCPQAWKRYIREWMQKEGLDAAD